MAFSFSHPLLSRSSRGFALAFVLSAAIGLSTAQQEPPIATPYTERETVQRVQIDVSVIDPRGNDWASVRGIPRTAFKIRLDGRLLEGEAAERVEFDEICGAPPTEEEGYLADELPTLIALVDLNFLGPAMRHAAAMAVDDLAELAERDPLRVKVLTFSRRIHSLTPDFTGNPDEIRAAAEMIRNRLSFGPGANGLGGLPDAVTEDPQSVIASNEPTAGFSGDDAPDPQREQPAFAVTTPGAEAPLLENQQNAPLLSPVERELIDRPVDPRPSIAALESVLISHGAIPGRKALVLFSSGWFDMSEELWTTHLLPTLQAAQRGFAIWTVDARGLGGQTAGSSRSRLLSQLASGSGGGSLHSAGRLAIAFERALDQLSCYYLFSVPVEPPREGRKRHTVTVDLDTKKHPEYWSYRVRTMSGFTLLDRGGRQKRQRLAAIMEPDAHGFPEVRVTAAYPARVGDDLVAPVEVSVLLSDLFFQGAGPGGGYVSRIAWEGAVLGPSGNIACELGNGTEKLIRAQQQPTRYPPSMLVMSERCRIPGPGQYEVRAVVEDLQTGDVGAASAFFTAPDPSPLNRPISSLRLGRNSGRDFLLRMDAGLEVEIPRDAARQAFIPLAAGETVVHDDRLMLRFVACGPQHPPRVVLYERSSADSGRVERRALYQVLVSLGGGQRGGGTSCREYQAVVPERTLEPGSYGLAVLERGISAESREELDRLLIQERMNDAIEFEVAAEGSPPPAQRGSET